ncbi:hypothetical protein B0T22DRAFT_142954 [Podospora appendiculata]|uniref:Uncharacterized protein n=1 Tax=Podospora appendiculata TaxID=314037 RepID=A0AAE0X8H3_9PEZI|nr:hypothetical protein B0T22DRAFT_142954 [Podospora appendiculata]
MCITRRKLPVTSFGLLEHRVSLTSVKIPTITERHALGLRSAGQSRFHPGRRIYAILPVKAWKTKDHPRLQTRFASAIVSATASRGISQRNLERMRIEDLKHSREPKSQPSAALLCSLSRPASVSRCCLVCDNTSNRAKRHSRFYPQGDSLADDAALLLTVGPLPQVVSHLAHPSVSSSRCSLVMHTRTRLQVACSRLPPGPSRRDERFLQSAGIQSVYLVTYLAILVILSLSLLKTGRELTDAQRCDFFLCTCICFFISLLPLPVFFPVQDCHVGKSTFQHRQQALLTSELSVAPRRAVRLAVGPEAQG